MKQTQITLATLILLSACVSARAESPHQFKPLFNGKDLTGWVNVNTDDDTWFVRDGLLVCTGHPIGVMRTDKQYENFILHIEWRHMEPGGNSGVFAWSEGTVPEGKRLPKGMEIQMLELDWPKLHKRADGTLPPIAYVHGELFGANGLKTTPDNPRGSRSKSIENRCKPKGEWNVYDVVCVDGDGQAQRQRQVRQRRQQGVRQEGISLPRIGRGGDSFPEYPDYGTAAGRDERGADGAGGEVNAG